jgi:hypothetical protein
MGRRVTDGLAVDVVAPAATAIAKGELYRVDNWTGFSAVNIGANDTERAFALNMDLGVWSCLVPVGVATTRGNFVRWSAAGTFKAGPTDLQDDGATRTLNSIAKVEQVRNSGGYARLKLVPAA